MKKLIFWLQLQLVVWPLFAQTSLKGIVTDHNHLPLPGASVVVRGTYTGTSTKMDGSFELTHLKPGPVVLTVSFMGFETAGFELDATDGKEIRIVLAPKVMMTEEVIVAATRAGDKTPMAYSNLSGEMLQERNFGQDIPYLLSLTPSFVATSDAGTGIGYTNFRIRGTDLNRINVTVNGIPLNDAESHGTWFVDQPDMAGSADNIQVQRGIGTSSNGAAAFGATINLQTLSFRPEAYAEYRAAAGSFNTFKNTVTAGTGLISGRFTTDARLSRITSDGFVDRAFSDLKSFYLSSGYHSAQTVIKAMISGGVQTTYQAWNGVPSVRLNSDPEGMRRYGEHGLYSADETSHMIASHPRTYNLYTYDNQVDNYQQDHFQLHLLHRFHPRLIASGAVHYTRGYGYYEQFKPNQKYSSYGMDNPVVNGLEIKRTDLVRRKILDNNFYGGIFSLNYRKGKTDLWWGGGWHQYDGGHYGNIIWASQTGSYPKGYEWYNNTGYKTDFNNYLKANYQLTDIISLFGDVQLRRIVYRIRGIDDDLRKLDQQHRFHFINPKAGIFIRPGDQHQGYLSLARASREPNRDNFTDASPDGPQPKHETMYDLEMGYQLKRTSFTFGINLYYMYYLDQLALTGQINDVGAPVMVNVGRSHRAGAELHWGIRFLSSFLWEANATISQNKIKNFVEFVDDWDTGQQVPFDLGTTNLAFSPALISNSQFTWTPAKNTFIKLISNYAGKQFIDNTSSSERVLNAWFVNNVAAGYTFRGRNLKQVSLKIMVNNLANTAYESNAWVYSYILEGKRYVMDGYFPQAGRHFMAGVDIGF